MTPFQSRLLGNIPALLTPLNSRLEVDAIALQRSTRRLLDHGGQGVVVLGTSGEFSGIDDDQRATAIQTVVTEVSGAKPVIVGCGEPNVRRTHDQTKAAADGGADGVLVNPPFYFSMTQDEVVGYFEKLVQASPLPVLLYNIPSLTGVSVEPATLPRLRDVGVEGTKDSSGVPTNTMAYVAAVGSDSDFRVIVGGDAFFLHLLDAGVCATTGLLANLAPQLTTQIFEAWQRGDYEQARVAQQRSNALLAAFLPIYPFLHATAKAVLSQIDLMEKWVAPPKTPLDDAQAELAMQAVRSFLPEFA